MIKDVIAAGGPSLIIPVALFALLFYAVRGVFGLHGRRSQHRREFLEHWDPKRIDDDLWLEVTIRHLYGTTLPAHVIRTAFKHPHTSQALLDLSELWMFFHYDPATRTVRWQHKRYQHAATRGLLRHWPVVRYLLFAFAGVGAMYYAARIEGLNQWAFSILALILGVCAFLSFGMGMRKGRQPQWARYGSIASTLARQWNRMRASVDRTNSARNPNREIALGPITRNPTLHFSKFVQHIHTITRP